MSPAPLRFAWLCMAGHDEIEGALPSPDPEPDGGLREDGDEERPAEAEEGPDDDVLGDLALVGIPDLPEPEDGFGGNEKTDTGWLVDEDEQEDESPFEVTDEAAAAS